MLPVEYSYGGPVGSKAWEPNSPSGALIWGRTGPVAVVRDNRVSILCDPDGNDLVVVSERRRCPVHVKVFLDEEVYVTVAN